MKLSKKAVLKQAEEVWERIKNRPGVPYKSKAEYIQEVLRLYEKVQTEGAGYYDRIKENIIRQLKQEAEIIRLRMERRKLVDGVEKVLLEKDRIDKGMRKK